MEQLGAPAESAFVEPSAPREPDAPSRPRLTLPKPEAQGPAPLRFDALQAPSPRPPAPGPAARAPTSRAGLVLTLVGSALALGLAAQTWTEPPPTPARSAPDVTGGRVAAAPLTPPPPPPPSGPAPETTPMLSVITRPPGAQVEIGGAVFGTSPIVRRSPAQGGLQVRLRKSGFRTWRGTVQPRDNGHYVVDVTLVPRR